MSYEYWIGGRCPNCGGANGQHGPGCLFGSEADHEAKEQERLIRGEIDQLYEQIQKLKPRPKPLRWRTGPVPEGLVVFFSYFIDGYGMDYGVGDGAVDGGISGDINLDWQEVRWLPLSEILDLIGGE